MIPGCAAFRANKLSMCLPRNAANVRASMYSV